MEDYFVEMDFEDGAPVVYDAATNMALDEYILRKSASEEAAYLRLYEFEDPAFVLSRRTCLDDVKGALRNGFDVARRSTNGSTIPCLDNGLAYSVAYPTDSFPDAFFQEQVAPSLVEALEGIGLDSGELSVGSRHDSIRYSDFDTPGDVSQGGTLVGSSLWRVDGAVLAQGLVAVEPWDVDFLDDNMSLRPGEKEFVDSLPSVKDFANGYDESDFVSSLLRSFTDGDYSKVVLESSDVDDLVRKKYSDDSWLRNGSSRNKGHCFVEREDSGFY